MLSAHTVVLTDGQSRMLPSSSPVPAHKSQPQPSVGFMGLARSLLSGFHFSMSLFGKQLQEKAHFVCFLFLKKHTMHICCQILKSSCFEYSVQCYRFLQWQCKSDFMVRTNWKSILPSLYLNTSYFLFFFFNLLPHLGLSHLRAGITYTLAYDILNEAKGAKNLNIIDGQKFF